MIKIILTTIALIICSACVNAQCCDASHFYAVRDYSADYTNPLNQKPLSDTLNYILNKLDRIEVWLDTDKPCKKFKIVSLDNTSIVLSGSINKRSVYGDGNENYGYIANLKQELSMYIRPIGQYKSATSIEDYVFEIEGNNSFSIEFRIKASIPNKIRYTYRSISDTSNTKQHTYKNYSTHAFSNRDISPKKFEAEFREGGKVVIRVKVDREGNITSKTVKSSSSAALTKIAMQHLSKAKFSADPNASIEQIGEVILIFKHSTE